MIRKIVNYISSRKIMFDTIRERLFSSTSQQDVEDISDGLEEIMEDYGNENGPGSIDELLANAENLRQVINFIEENSSLDSSDYDNLPDKE